MKKLHPLLIALFLIIPFIMILLLSPGMDAYKTQFNTDNYERIAEISAPTEEPFIFRGITDNLPFTIDVSTGPQDKIEVWISNTVPEVTRKYIRKNLKYDTEIYSESNNGNMNLILRGRFVFFEGEDWIIIRDTEPYDQLFGSDSPLLKLILPKNIIYSREAEQKTTEK